MKIFIGIDPGKSGSIATINEKGHLAITKMPETPKEVLNFLRVFKGQDCMCVLEKVGGMPGDGGSRAFSFGEGYGVLKTCLLVHGIKTELVTPQKWQKEFQLGTTKTKAGSKWKNILKAKAESLYPEKSIFLWGSDAVLIAEYCRRTFGK